MISSYDINTNNTPNRRFNQKLALECFTPPAQTSLSRELKQVLNERNLLTAKSRKKVCNMLDPSPLSSPSSSSSSPMKKTPSRLNQHQKYQRDEMFTNNYNNNNHNKSKYGHHHQQTDEQDKRKTFRRQAIQEILTTERSYINQLNILMDYFIRPLRERSIITNDQFMALFGQVEMIYNLNAELLTELETDMENVATAFKRMAPFFKLYSVYAFDYNRAQLILQDLTEKNVEFRKFLETTESHADVQRKLISLLIAPIQRVPRYRLLLQQVILYSSPSEPDFKILQDSIKEVESTVSHLNGVIQDQENTQILLDLQNSLVNRLPNIVKPSRKVIKEGILEKMSSTGTTLKRYCVLMSDIFMYCKCLKERNKQQLTINSLQCCCIFPLKKCRISEIFSSGTFKLTCQGDGIIFCAGSSEAGRLWITQIKETIDLHIQCRKTIRKGSSKRTPIRRRDLKNFDRDREICSPTPKKYDYESVFKVASDSDSGDEGGASGDGNAFNCFNLKSRNIFKRKHGDGNDAAVITAPIPHQTPYQQKSSQNNWYSKAATQLPSMMMMMTSTPERTETSTTQQQQQQQQQSPSPTDPTYGFVQYNSQKSQSPEKNYFNYQDILYPLRSSTGSNKSSSSGGFITYRQQQQQQQLHQQQQQYQSNETAPTFIHKKRVKFDISANNQYLNISSNYPKQSSQQQQQQQPYPFSNVHCIEKSPTKSLRNRIVNFFANLF